MIIVINGRNLNNLITGIGVYTQELATNIARSREVEVILLTNNSSLTLPEVKIVSDFWQFLGPIYDIFLFGLRGLGAEIVFSPANSGALYSLSKLKVTTIHDLSTFDRPRDYPLINRLVIRFGILVAIFSSDIIFTDSMFSKKCISRAFKKRENVWAVPLGVNRNELLKIPKKMLSGKNATIKIVTNATHSRRKNIFSLIKAIENCKNFSKIRVIITGARFKKIQEGFVDQVGYLPRGDYYKVLAKADIFIYPSFYEGFGLPVLEASEVGVNVLTSDRAATKEIVFDSQITFNPENIEDISKKIDWLIKLSLERKKALISKQKMFVRKFDWQKTAQRVLSVLKMFLNKKTNDQT